MHFLQKLENLVPVLQGVPGNNMFNLYSVSRNTTSLIYTMCPKYDQDHLYMVSENTTSLIYIGCPGIRQV